MTPVPVNLDLSPLVGQELVTASISRYALHLVFEEGSITCHSEVRVDLGGEGRLVFDGDGWGDVTPLPQIIGRAVTTWVIDGSHDFSIALAGGAMVRFQSEDSPYESFVISLPGLTWVM